MADDPTPDPAATADPKPDPDPDPTPDDGLSDAGRAAIRKERAAAREATKRANELEGRLKELEDRDKTDAQKLVDERDALKTQVPSLEAENLRLKVALAKGLVGDLAFIAERLRGSTQKELEADADALLEKIGARSSATDFDAGPRDTTLKTDDMNARIRAAAGRR